MTNPTRIDMKLIAHTPAYCYAAFFIDGQPVAQVRKSEGRVIREIEACGQKSDQDLEQLVELISRVREFAEGLKAE